MIRINLLGGERQVKKKGFTFDSGRQTMVACILLLVASAAGVGYWFWMLRQASIQVDQDIADATREQTRLQRHRIGRTRRRGEGRCEIRAGGGCGVAFQLLHTC